MTRYPVFGGPGPWSRKQDSSPGRQGGNGKDASLRQETWVIRLVLMVSDTPCNLREATLPLRDLVFSSMQGQSDTPLVTAVFWALGTDDQR